MIKEFIPYEQALQLKELGFDEPCFGYYNSSWSNKNELLFPQYAGEFENWNDSQHLCSTPTYSQAFRFFREKYDLQLWLGDGGMLSKAFVKITGYKHDKFYFSSSEPMEYEEAELYGLKQLIKIAKQQKQ